MSYIITSPVSLNSSGGVSFTFGIGSNSSGIIVGTGTSGYETIGVTWQAGALTALMPLPGDTSANGYDINDAGTVVGQSLSATGIHHAAIWVGGVVQSLADFGYGSRASAVNQQGQIVGSAETSAGLDEAVEWQNGAMSVLGILPGGGAFSNSVASRALALNNSNQVVGVALTSGDEDHGFLWQNGAMTDLGTLTGGTTSEAVAINASGQIIGFGTDASGIEQAIQWTGGVATQLANLTSGGSGEAQAANDSGVIAGYSTTSTGVEHAVIWQNGAVFDLNTLLPTGSSWVLNDARGIDNQGRIVGTATHLGYSVQFTLTLGSSTTAVTSVQAALSAYQASASSGPFLISDTAANIQADLDTLESLAKASKLFSIMPSDALPPTLTVTAAQYTADADALDDLTGNYKLSVTGVSAYGTTTLLANPHVASMAISDTAYDISSELVVLAPLAKAGTLTSITVTDGLVVNLLYKNLIADTPAIGLLQGNYSLAVYGNTVAQAQTLTSLPHLKVIEIEDTAANVLSNDSAISALSQSYTVLVDVSDSGANIAANLDALQAHLLKLDDIVLNDTGIPTLSIAAAQLTSDAGALRAVIGSFNLSISAASGTNLAIQGYHSAFETISDTVVFSGAASEYQIATLANGQGVTVTDTGTGRTSVDTLTGINAIQFSDATVIIASAPGASGGTPTSGNITELYGAVFGRLPDTAGLAYYQNELAQNPGESLVTFATHFLASPEYTNNPAHSYAQSTAGETQFVTDMYNNLLHRAPEAGAVPYYLNLISQLTQGATVGTSAYSTADQAAHATLLVDFSNSGEFLNDVQITAQHPASSQHWLVLV